MPFARGATLTTATTFGHADTSSLGPTAGNGFYKRWPDDLALLQEIGLTDVRFTFDWSRLQPKPGDLDRDWSERFEQILAAADAIGLRVWATLYDGAEPRWVTNEGGLADADVAEKWWPRFAEKVADHFGTGIAGWIPFSVPDDRMSVAAWKNTWTTLSRGGAPVVATVDTTTITDLAAYLDTSDLIGVVLAHDELTDSIPDDARFEQMRERLHRKVVAAAEAAGNHSLVVTQFTPHHDDADVAGRIVEVFTGALDRAIDDGVALDVAFLDPAIAGPDSPNGLLSAERDPQPAAAAFVPDVD